MRESTILKNLTYLNEDNTNFTYSIIEWRDMELK